MPKNRGFWKVFVRKRLKKDFWIITVKRRPWVKWMLISILLILTVVPPACYLTFYYYTGYIPFVGDLNDDNGQLLDFEKLGRSDFKKASYVYAKDGKTIIGVFSYEIRNPVKINEIPPIIKNAFIAAEDKRFYSWLQFGIDPIATTRAGIIYIGHGIGFKYGKKQGASGIPQQLSRTLFAEEVADFRDRPSSGWPGIRRKLKEARVAIQLVKKYPKDKIMEGYLNLIWLGHGVNGVAEATRRYYGKDIRGDEFNLREAAVLASLNKSSYLYCPIYHKPEEPELKNDLSEEKKKELKEKYEEELTKEGIRITRAHERENWVLSRMRDDGYLTEEQYQKNLVGEKESLQSDLIRFTPLKDRQFVYSARAAKEMLLGTGFNDEELTYSGGLRITTCIDAKINKILNDELMAHLAELNSEIEDKTNPIDVSAVAIEVKTGCIAALIGGYKPEGGKPYDRALARRSVGSAVKPFVYATAFENGKTFDDTIKNLSLRMLGANGKTWVPQNFREDNPVPLGNIPIYVGQIRSVNLPTLRLAMEIGMDKIVETMHKMGVWGVRGIIKDPHGKIIFRMPGAKDTGGGIVPLLPTAIGASDVNLLELVNAYAIFFRNGLYLTPKLVLEVKDQDGKARYQTSGSEPFRSISEETALKELILMRATTKVGTAKISMRGIEQQVACKTGTSNNPNEELGDGPGDVSVVCGTPELVMGIRIGHDMPKPIIIPRYMKRVSGRADMQVSGGWVAGPLSRRIWDRIYAEKPKVEFPSEVETGLEELLAIYPERYK